MVLRVAVPKETTRGERRVALTPEVVGKLTKDGLSVVVESGAGTAAFYPDELYRAAGATVEPNPEAVLSGGGLVLKVQPPSPSEAALLAPGTVLVGLLAPSRSLETIARLRDGRV